MRKIALRMFAILSYWTGLDALLYRLNRKAKRIITFHNVLPDNLVSQVHPIGCMESASEFEAKLVEVGRRFSFSTDICDASSATVTFDDGFLNQYEVAGEILHRRNIPAILFVTGDVVGVDPASTLTIDKIILWNELAPDEAVEKVFGVILPRDELWVKYTQPAYRSDWKNRGRAFFERLEAAYSITEIIKQLPLEWVRLRLSGVSRLQLSDLQQRGWEIGWHTKSHFPLGMLDREGKRDELSSPMEYRSVVLSYPYGDINAIGEESLSIAKELGYPWAVSNDPDMSLHRGRFFLMRMALPSNKYELHFVLSGLKYFIKYRKLLPTIEVGQGAV